MVLVPDLPRWQQYLLLLSALVAVITGANLHLAGGRGLESMVPLILPFMLWWPQPTCPERRLYWWLMLGLLFAVVLTLFALVWSHVLGLLLGAR
ncbi:hypothetical protein [Hymenobacter crusticola]|uniref:Uncharacterized protein n=1 Tax=Hymenobacter crusticola TaxID=1770526 RepID=A0A243W818_9BACT|nr:hypothetical protein [Hymenobacter crusticola]OUJ71123.1 hypothetical protein BXP70_22675 [Hymenobacter crusticola]